MNKDKSSNVTKEKSYDSDIVLGNLFQKLGLLQKIRFYIKTDPEFSYEFKELNAKAELEEITPEEKKEALLDSLVEAEYRRTVFMAEALQKRSQGKLTKRKPLEKVLKTYKQNVEAREEKLSALKERVRKRRQKMLEHDPDYKSVVTIFSKMKERKAELAKT